MKQFTSIHDVPDPAKLISDALELKKAGRQFSPAQKLTLGLIFMNPSLRTRLSTQKAAQQLSMNILTVNATTEGWALETGNLPMDGATVEHIEEAAAVMGEYCDIVGIRNFPSLTDREKDESEETFNTWITHCRKPVLSLESATRHPLQSLADMMTITEHATVKRPKVVLSWAPHIKPVPHAVANSFAEWMRCMHAEFVIACPEEAMLSEKFTSGASITHDQEAALEGADFVYAKSWASRDNYGSLITGKESWMLDEAKMRLTNNGKLMHCLPVRRDVEIPAALLKGKNSLVVQQAANRVYAAQAVLKALAETNYPATLKQSHYDHSY